MGKISGFFEFKIETKIDGTESKIVSEFVKVHVKCDEYYIYLATNNVVPLSHDVY
jgi:hypothetical protein